MFGFINDLKLYLLIIKKKINEIMMKSNYNKVIKTFYERKLGNRVFYCSREQLD